MNDFAGYRRFTFFPSYWFAVADLPEDQQLEALSALISYGISGIMPENPSPIARLVLGLTIPTIDKSAKKIETLQANGRLGGRPPKKKEENQTGTKENQTETKNAFSPRIGEGIGERIKDNGAGKGAGKGKDSADKPRPASRFSPPSISDISDFCHEAGISIDVQAFYDFYSSNGWKVGRNKMKDWRAAARNWARRDMQQQKPARGQESTLDRLRRMEQEGRFDE